MKIIIDSEQLFGDFNYTAEQVQDAFRGMFYDPSATNPNHHRVMLERRQILQTIMGWKFKVEVPPTLEEVGKQLSDDELKEVNNKLGLSTDFHGLTGHDLYNLVERRARHNNKLPQLQAAIHEVHEEHR